MGAQRMEALELIRSGLRGPFFFCYQPFKGTYSD